MKRRTAKDLLRLVHGDLDPGRTIRLRRRIEADPALIEPLEELQSTWRSLEPPRATVLPAEFAGQVVAEAERRAALAEGWPSQGWARLASAAVLAAGVAVGVVVSPSIQAEDEWAEVFAVETTLADSYWQALGEEVGSAIESESAEQEVTP